MTRIMEELKVAKASGAFVALDGNWLRVYSAPDRADFLCAYFVLGGDASVLIAEGVVDLHDGVPVSPVVD